MSENPRHGRTGTVSSATAGSPASVPRVRRDGAGRSSLGYVFAGAAVVPVVFAFAGPGLVARQTVGVAVCAAVAAGYLTGALPRSRPARDAARLGLVFAALCTWVGLGILWGDSTERTLIELSRDLAYGGVLALSILGASSRSWRAAALGLAAALIAVVGTALFSRLFPGLFSGFDPDLGLNFRRLSFPLGYWNGLAGLAAIAFGILLLWTSVPPRRALRPLAFAALPLPLLCTYLTFSRAGLVLLGLAAYGVVALGAPLKRTAVAAALALLAAAVAVLVARTQSQIITGSGGDGGWLVALTLSALGVALYRVEPRLPRARRSIPRRRSGISGLLAPLGAAALVAGLVAVALFAESGASSPPPNSDPSAVTETDPSVRLLRFDGERGAIWGSAFDAFKTDPVTGIGAGGFAIWWQRDSEGEPPVSDAHSLYLESLAEIGLIGCGLLFALGLISTRILASARSRFLSRGDLAAGGPLILIVGLIATHAAIDWVWEVPAVAVFAFAAIGIVSAVQSQPRSARPLRGSRVASVCLVAVGAAVVQVPSLVGGERLESARLALAGGAGEVAVAHADEAVRAAPWSAAAHAVRANAYLLDGDTDAARRDAGEAIRLEPTDPSHQLLLAAIERDAGHEQAAAAALVAAQALQNP